MTTAWMEATAPKTTAQPVPGSSTPAPSLKSWLLPGVVSSLLLYASFFPLAWGWLAWFGLAPLLSLVRLEASKKKVFFGAYLAGLVFFVPALEWMRVADWRMHFTWLLLALYCAAYFPVAIGLMRLLDRRTQLPLVVTVSVVWVGLEFVRSFMLGGFAWYYLGHAQHQYLPLIQVADVTGVYGISFVVAFVNAWLFETWWQWRQQRGFPLALRIQGVVGVALIVGTLAYGSHRLEQQTFEPGPRVALLQSNLDQRIRDQALMGGPSGPKILDQFRHLCELSTRSGFGPQLVVWPETSFPAPWVELPRDLNRADPEDKTYMERLYQLLAMLFAGGEAHHLVGVNLEDKSDPDAKPRRYNSALYFDGRSRLLGRYDKVHPLPFGEYIPLRDSLPFMKYFFPYPEEQSILAGDKLLRFELGKHRFGVLICYEDTDPFMAREYGRETSDGPGVDFLVNISNDGWFDGTCEHDEHLAICRFRAIETRRTVVRAVNMGISAVIDGNDRVLGSRDYPQEENLAEKFHVWAVNSDQRGWSAELPLARWGEYKKTAGVLLAQVPIDHRASLYCRLGDWLPVGCWIVVLGGVLIPSLAARRSAPLVRRG